MRRHIPSRRMALTSLQRQLCIENCYLIRLKTDSFARHNFRAGAKLCVNSAGMGLLRESLSSGDELREYRTVHRDFVKHLHRELAIRSTASMSLQVGE
jgi:hypothetical protein